MSTQLGFHLYIGSTYEDGSLNPDNFYDFENEDFKDYDSDKISNLLCDVWPDYIAGLTDICKKNLTKFWGLLAKYHIKLIDCKFETPKYYNYKNDRLGVDVELEDVFFTETLPKFEKELIDYYQNIKQNSQDGYISFEPDDYTEMIKDLREGGGSAIYGLLNVLSQKDPDYNDFLELAQDDIISDALLLHNDLFYTQHEKAKP